jgi:Low affinity iron permease
VLCPPDFGRFVPIVAARGELERLCPVAQLPSGQLATSAYRGKAEAKDGNEPRPAAFFGELASKTAQASDRASTFMLAASVIIVWAVSGPLLGFSDTWRLVINTGTTIVTFLMVFLIQNSQNRRSGQAGRIDPRRRRAEFTRGYRASNRQGARKTCARNARRVQSREDRRRDGNPLHEEA